MAMIKGARDITTPPGENTPVQLSEATSKGTVQEAVHEPAGTYSVWSPGQFVITGGVVSSTMKRVVHDVLLPAASVTVTVMTCVPFSRNAPAGGFCVMVKAVEQLSVGFRPPRRLGTVSLQFAFVYPNTVSGGQVITGGTASAGVRTRMLLVALAQTPLVAITRT